MPVKNFLSGTRQIIAWIFIAVNCAWFLLKPQHLVAEEKPLHLDNTS